MKRLPLTLVFAVLVTAAVAAPEKFSETVSPDQAAAAGLNRLTPAQVAALDGLVEQYKSGELAAARAAADRAIAAKQAAETEAAKAKVAAARAEAAQAEAQRAAAAKPAESPGVLAKAKALLKPTAPATEPIVASTIVGKFRGWEPRQVFILATGERLQVANNERYFTPAVENPRVELVRASFGGFWMQFPDLGGVRVRVNLVQ